MYAASILLAALLIDQRWGEPPNRWHPVAALGHVIEAAVRIAPQQGRLAQTLAGASMAVGIPLACAASGAALLHYLAAWPVYHWVAAVLLCKTSFAVRALGDAGDAVAQAVARRDVPGARVALRSLCSRNPDGLESPELVAATVESVAENASDSVVAPLLFYCLGGVPGALFYRAVNTLDAMIGYHGRYEYLGKAAARLDDACNLIPARLTAAALLLAGRLHHLDVAQGWRILRRDGRRTESPNAGLPMAAMAGLLGVQLTKVGHYILGDATRPLHVGVVHQAWRVVHTAVWLVAAAVCVARAGIATWISD